MNSIFRERDLLRGRIEEALTYPQALVNMTVRIVAREQPNQIDLPTIIQTIRDTNPHAREDMLAPAIFTAETLEYMRQQGLISKYIPTPPVSFLDEKKVDFIIITPQERAALMQVTSDTNEGKRHRKAVRLSNMGGSEPLVFVFQIYTESRKKISREEAMKRIMTGIGSVKQIPLAE